MNYKICCMFGWIDIGLVIDYVCKFKVVGGINCVGIGYGIQFESLMLVYFLMVVGGFYVGRYFIRYKLCVCYIL